VLDKGFVQPVVVDLAARLRLLKQSAMRDLRVTPGLD